MGGLLHQPASWGEEWLRRLQDSSTPGDLFRETSAMEEVVLGMMAQAAAQGQGLGQDAGLAQGQTQMLGGVGQAMAGGGFGGGLQRAGPMTQQLRQPNQHTLPPPQPQPSTSSAAPPADAPGNQSMSEIWSLLKPTSAPNSVSAPPPRHRGQPTGQAMGPPPPPGEEGVVSHRSTQLENIYSILQRFNSTLQGPAMGEEEDPGNDAGGDQCEDANGGGLADPVSLADQFARDSSWEGKQMGAGPSGDGAGAEGGAEFELGPEAIIELPGADADAAARAQYSERCRSNRAERLRKRKEKRERPEEGEEGSADPAVVKRVARQMRNRESAERSRLKRQAYTDKLEAEVAKLKGEKEELASQVQDLQAGRGAATAALSGEQLVLLRALQAQVAEFQRRESKLELPPLKPLRKHRTMDL